MWCLSEGFSKENRQIIEATFAVLPERHVIARKYSVTKLLFFLLERYLLLENCSEKLGGSLSMKDIISC